MLRARFAYKYNRRSVDDVKLIECQLSRNQIKLYWQSNDLFTCKSASIQYCCTTRQKCKNKCESHFRLAFL